MEERGLFTPTQASHRVSALSLGSNLQHALEAFHEHMLAEKLSLHTVRAFDSDLRLLAQFLGLETAIGDITTGKLEDFVAYLRHGRPVPCKLKSLDRRATTLKAFFAWLTTVGATSTDPAAPLLHYRATSPLPYVLFEQQIAQLLAATEKRWREPEKGDARPHLLVTLLLATGIKKSECLGIAVADMDVSDPSTPSVLIRHETITQSYKQRRLRLPAQSAAALPEYLAQYRPRVKLFECTARNLEYVLDECCKRAGLPPHTLSFEVLRWTCAVRDLKGGVAEDDLRRKLGLSRLTWGETLHKLKRLTRPAL